MLKSVVEHLEHEEKKLTEEEFLQTLAYFGAFGTFAMLFCDEMELLFEMYRRSAEAGKAVYYGEWLGPETIVCPGEFFKWAEDQGFPLPEEAAQTIRQNETEQEEPEPTSPSNLPDNPLEYGILLNRQGYQPSERIARLKERFPNLTTAQIGAYARGSGPSENSKYANKKWYQDNKPR